MYVTVWSFEVVPERQAEFERVYAPDGDWARLFARSPEYLGTELEHDPEQPLRYVTVDRWSSAAAFAAFREQWKAEYEALDRVCAALTTSETSLGAFDA
jgi:heme-degrading monooxygenase HmoA